MAKTPSMEKKTGFTTFEIVIGMAILVAIAGLAIGVDSNFYRTQSLVAERDSFSSALRTARSQAMNNLDQAPHGVYIASNQYTLFEGASYASRNRDYDQVFNPSPGLFISGPAEVIFSQLDGNSNSSGTIVISNGLSNLPIAINNEGRISW